MSILKPPTPTAMVATSSSSTTTTTPRLPRLEQMQPSIFFDHSASPNYNWGSEHRSKHQHTFASQSFLTFPYTDRYSMDTEKAKVSLTDSLISPPEEIPLDSPEDAVSDNFPPTPSPLGIPQLNSGSKADTRFPSPPTSPAAFQSPTTIVDPFLYPVHRSLLEPSQPLFSLDKSGDKRKPSSERSQSLDSEAIEKATHPHRSRKQNPPTRSRPSTLWVEDDVELAVNAHIAARESAGLSKTAPPKRGDYVEALEFKSGLAAAISRFGTREWLVREMRWIDQDNKARTKSLQKIAPAPVSGSRNIVSGPRNGVQKTRSPTSNVLGAQVQSRRPRVQKVRKVHDSTATPEPPKRNHTGAATKEDKLFHLLEDCIPPIDHLRSKLNLKVEWKPGTRLHVADDPDAGLLHEEELELASTLRLDCATYLTSKRRIFLERIDCLKRRKEFKKTDAQKACKIDVNKASKLWMAFEKNGWFEERLFTKYMHA